MPLWRVKPVCLGAASALFPFPLSVIPLLEDALMPLGVNKPGVEAADFIVGPLRFAGCRSQWLPSVGTAAQRALPARRCLQPLRSAGLGGTVRTAVRRHGCGGWRTKQTGRVGDLSPHLSVAFCGEAVSSFGR